MDKVIKLSSLQMKEVVGGLEQFKISDPIQDGNPCVCSRDGVKDYNWPCTTDQDCFLVGQGEGKCVSFYS